MQLSGAWAASTFAIIGVGSRHPEPSAKGFIILQNMLHMPQSVLEFQAATVLHAVQTCNSELGHVQHVL